MVGCWVLGVGLVAVVVRMIRLMLVFSAKECTKTKKLTAKTLWPLGVGYWVLAWSWL